MLLRLLATPHLQSKARRNIRNRILLLTRTGLVRPLTDVIKNAKQVKILFGSQTGTAAMYANLLAKELEAGGWASEAQDLAEYEVDTLRNEDLVIFVTSCFGKGEPPDSARRLWSYLHDQKRDDEKAPLQKLQYAIFGLGNSACASLWGGAGALGFFFFEANSQFILLIALRQEYIRLLAAD